MSDKLNIYCHTNELVWSYMLYWDGYLGTRKMGLCSRHHSSSLRASWSPMEARRCGLPWRPNASPASRCLGCCSCWGTQCAGKLHLRNPRSKSRGQWLYHKGPCWSILPKGANYLLQLQNRPKRNPWGMFAKSNLVQSTLVRRMDRCSKGSYC